MGKSFDKRLRELGAVPFHAPAFADEATNMEETIEPWLASFYASLDALRGSGGGGGGGSGGSNDNGAEEEPLQAAGAGAGVGAGAAEGPQGSSQGGGGGGQPAKEPHNHPAALFGHAGEEGCLCHGLVAAVAAAAESSGKKAPWTAAAEAKKAPGMAAAEAAAQEAPGTEAAAVVPAAVAGETGSPASVELAPADGQGSEAGTAPGTDETLPPHRWGEVFGAGSRRGSALVSSLIWGVPYIRAGLPHFWGCVALAARQRAG